MTLEKTRFRDAPVVAVTAKPSSTATDMFETGIPTLISTLKEMTFVPNRSPDGKMVFNVDHCFGIKGQGTVMTGTVLQGSVKVGDVSTYTAYTIRLYVHFIVHSLYK